MPENATWSNTLGNWEHNPLAPTKAKQQTASSRVSIINAVRTPPGFFVLVVLVVEVALGGLAARTGGQNQLVALYGMLFVVLALIAVVAFFAYRRPEALTGERPPVSNALPNAETPVVEIKRTLCAVTEMFESLGADEDIRLLGSKFPGTVTDLRLVSAQTLKDTLAQNKFEIIHLLGYVDARRYCQ
jgi:hypothetical protein